MKAYNPEMRRTALFLAFSCLVFACKTSGDPAKAVEQYRAWCFSKSRPLGNWHRDRAAAEYDLKRHKAVWPHHRASIKIWTGNPAKTGAK